MRPRSADPVKLVISVFTGDSALFQDVFKRLAAEFGPLDLLTGDLPFSTTDYYDEEFGGGLKRKVASFEVLMEAGRLPEIKIFTNGLEDEYLRDGKRRVNIDPGYMALEKFVLASCKNFSHRIFLKDGVYADLTLMFVGDDFVSLPWTYPDYMEERMKGVLKEIRKRYAFLLGKGLRFG